MFRIKYEFIDIVWRDTRRTRKSFKIAIVAFPSEIHILVSMRELVRSLCIGKMLQHRLLHRKLHNMVAHTATQHDQYRVESYLKTVHTLYKSVSNSDLGTAKAFSVSSAR